MTHPHSDQGSEPRMHSIGSFHGRSRGLAIILTAKLLIIAVAVLLFWVLNVEFGIGVAALIFLHLAIVSALVVLAMRRGMLRGWRK